jgi:DNA polymerase III sliding clamp (beta) subunit (PCNA family)
MKKQDLLTALEIVKPGLASKELIEQTTAFAFVKGRVVTYNDEISISHPVKGLDITGAVQASELYSLLGKLKKDEIEMKIDGSEVVLKSGRSKAGLTIHEQIKMPLEELGESEDWEKLPEDFMHFMEFVVGSCSRDQSDPVLTCVHVDQKGIVESSDGFRVARGEVGQEFPIESFLIPASSVIELIKLDPVWVASGQGWVHFRTADKTEISCRIFEDEFPNCDKHLDVQGMELSLPRTTLDILDRAGVFAKRDYFLDEAVTITLEKNRITLESRSESGWFEESANMKYEEEPLSFAVTPTLLKGILEETLDCVLSDRMLKFEGAGWEYATALKSTG